MEDNLIKPDVVLVTKNVMVPLALPTPKSKLIVRMSASKKKTKIVKSRKTRPLSRQTLHFSQDDNCKHERGKDPSEQIYLNCNYDSSINLDQESEEDYENSYQFRDFPDEAKTENKSSPRSFSMATAMKSIPKSICETILLPKSSRSLNSNAKVTIANEIFLEKSKKDESDCLRTEVDAVNIFKDKASNALRESITEIRRCISGDISSKRFDISADCRVETFAKDKCVNKYSWQDLDNWVPPSEKRKFIKSERISKEPKIEKRLNCEIKYSWQIVGTAVQTSEAMIEILPLQDEPVEVQNYPCSVKYSWQIIGTGTQVSFRDSAKDSSKYEKDYWDGKIVNTVKRSLNEGNSTDVEKSVKLHKYKISYSGYGPAFTLRDDTKINDDSRNAQKQEQKTIDMDSEIETVTVDGSDEDILDKTLSASFDEETEPLMPMLDSTNNEGSQAKNSAAKEELKFRLTSALKKLEQSDKCIDANWTLDCSPTNMKDDLSGTEEKLPRDVESDFISIIASAEEYISKLKSQLGDLDIADEQIVKSTNGVMNKIDDTYQDLINKVSQEINNRRDLMRLEAEVYKVESLGPLKACRQQVNAQIRSSRKLINELSRALVDAKLRKPQECKIIEASSHLGRIPAVPQPDELPYITFSPPSKNMIDSALREIFELGSVLRMGPAQIIEIEERPGSVFVKWNITDPEYATEEQHFVIQRANGEIHDVTSDAFITIYNGPETSCFVRDLQVDCPVTLRVGLQSMETAWSVHRFARTKISPYNWALDNRNYMITNGGKVAAKITDRMSTLFSQSPQVDANQIIEFKFLEVSHDGKNTEGIALTSDRTNNDDDVRRFGSLLITPHGKIFMDGDEKLMKLPRIRLGARIVFTIQRKDEEHLRINIESGEKAVTYDWAVQTPLYFAARFSECDRWNVMVK